MNAELSRIATALEKIASLMEGEQGFLTATPATSEVKAEVKEEAKTEKPKADKPKAEKKAEPKAEVKEETKTETAAITAADIRKLGGELLAAGRAEEFTGTLKKFGAAKVSELAETNFAKVHAALAALLAPKSEDSALE